MILKKSIFILSILLQTFSFAQKSATYFRTVDYFDKEDSTKNYAVVYRPNAPAKKMLILLPAFGESPMLAERETNIPTIAAINGILTVILSNNEGSASFQIDGNAQTYLDSMIPILLLRYGIPDDAYYLGGFSLGGSGVVKYVQHCNTYDIKLKPKAVFAIDPPLDFLRLYKVYDNWMNDTAKFYNTNKPLYKMMLDKMRTFFQGDLSTAYENYVHLSPYCYDDKNKFGVRLFENTPITIYCEPDFKWAMLEKRWNAYDLNITDNVSFINELTKNGNQQAQLILTQNKGIRKLMNMKQPHSWSIADANETVKWLLKY